MDVFESVVLAIVPALIGVVGAYWVAHSSGSRTQEVLLRWERSFPLPVVLAVDVAVAHDDEGGKP